MFIIYWQVHLYNTWRFIMQGEGSLKALNGDMHMLQETYWNGMECRSRIYMGVVIICVWKCLSVVDTVPNRSVNKVIWFIRIVTTWWTERFFSCPPALLNQLLWYYNYRFFIVYIFIIITFVFCNVVVLWAIMWGSDVG